MASNCGRRAPRQNTNLPEKKIAMGVTPSPSYPLTTPMNRYFMYRGHKYEEHSLNTVLATYANGRTQLLDISLEACHNDKMQTGHVSPIINPIHETIKNFYEE